MTHDDKENFDTEGLNRFLSHAALPSYFAHGVMADIRRSSVEYGSPWKMRWLVPAIGLAFAGLVLTLSHPLQEAAVSTDTILLSSHAEEAAPVQWLESTSGQDNQMLNYLVGQS